MSTILTEVLPYVARSIPLNKGTKTSKDRITIVLCANADGFDKLKLLNW